MINNYQSQMKALLAIITDQWPQAQEYQLPQLKPDRAESFIWLTDTSYQLLHVTVSSYLPSILIKPFTIKERHEFNEIIRLSTNDNSLLDSKINNYCLYTDDCIHIDNIHTFKLNLKEEHDISKLREIVDLSFAS